MKKRMFYGVCGFRVVVVGAVVHFYISYSYMDSVRELIIGTDFFCQIDYAPKTNKNYDVMESV